MNMPLSPSWTDIAIRLALTMLATLKWKRPERATPPHDLLAALDGRYEIATFELTTDNGR